MKIKFERKKIKIFFQQLPEKMVNKGMFTLFFLFFLSLLIGVFLFLIYYPKVGEKSGKKLIKFEEKKYAEIMKFWKEKEKMCEQAEEKSYSHFFER